MTRVVLDLNHTVEQHQSETGNEKVTSYRLHIHVLQKSILNSCRIRQTDQQITSGERGDGVPISKWWWCLLYPLGCSALKGSTAGAFVVPFRVLSRKKSVSIDVLLWNWYFWKKCQTMPTKQALGTSVFFLFFFKFPTSSLVLLIRQSPQSNRLTDWPNVFKLSLLFYFHKSHFQQQLQESQPLIGSNF